MAGHVCQGCGQLACWCESSIALDSHALRDDAVHDHESHTAHASRPVQHVIRLLIGLPIRLLILWCAAGPEGQGDPAAGALQGAAVHCCRLGPVHSGLVVQACLSVWQASRAVAVIVTLCMEADFWHYGCRIMLPSQHSTRADRLL